MSLHYFNGTRIDISDVVVTNQQNIFSLPGSHLSEHQQQIMEIDRAGGHDQAAMINAGGYGIGRATSISKFERSRAYADPWRTKTRISRAAG
jgi:hypothetical protein